MSLQFIKIQRGRDFLIHKGFIHKQERTRLFGNVHCSNNYINKNCICLSPTMKGKMISSRVLGILIVNSF